MIAVTYGHFSSNLGDVAVTRGVEALLGAASDDEVVVLKVGEPVPDGAIVAYGGGEHLFSGPRLRSYATEIARAPRGVVLPSTFGPFDAADEPLFREVARHPIAARDTRSAEIAQGLIGRPVPVLLDPAFFLEPGPPAAGSHTIWAPRREDIGLRLGTYKQTSSARRTVAFKTYRDRISRASGDDLIVCHTRQDERLCLRLSEAAGVRWVQPETLEEMLELYRGCGRVVASRFHALVFARLFDKPYEGIPWPGHGHKISGLPVIDDLPEWRRRTVAWVRSALGQHA